MDLSSYWAFYKRNQSRGGQFLFIVIALLVGWQLGRTTSPYYASSPIIFEDTACNAGAPEELTKLKEEGQAQRTKKTKAQALEQNNPAPSTVTKPAVAGTTDNTAPSGKFVGSINSDLFHDLSCSSSKRIKEANQIWFDSITDAENAGYSPSKCTKKLLGI